MPRRINHRLKWVRIAHPYTHTKEHYAIKVKLSPRIEVTICFDASPNAKSPWRLTLYLDKGHLFAWGGYTSLEQAKGAVCNHVNALTADLIRAKQKADGSAIRRKPRSK